MAWLEQSREIKPPMRANLKDVVSTYEAQVAAENAQAALDNAYNKCPGWQEHSASSNKLVNKCFKLPLQTDPRINWKVNTWGNYVNQQIWMPQSGWVTRH